MKAFTSSMNFYLIIIYLWSIYIIMIFLQDELPAANWVQIFAAGVIFLLYLLKLAVSMGYKPRHPHNTKQMRQKRSQFKDKTKAAGHTKTCYRWMVSDPVRRGCICEVGQSVVPDGY